MFEPVLQYANTTKARFSFNENVNVKQAASSESDRKRFIIFAGLGSCIYEDELVIGPKENIRIISIVDFKHLKGYSIVDIMKINIDSGEYELIQSLLDYPELMKGIKDFSNPVL